MLEMPEWDAEDVPCYMITVKVPVSGWDSDRAIDYLTKVLEKAKAEEECQIWDIEVWIQNTSWLFITSAGRPASLQ